MKKSNVSHPTVWLSNVSLARQLNSEYNVMRPNMLCIFGSYIVYIFEVNMEDILFIIDSDLKQIHLKYSMNSHLSSLYLKQFQKVFTLYEALTKISRNTSNKNLFCNKCFSYNSLLYIMPFRLFFTATLYSFNISVQLERLLKSQLQIPIQNDFLEASWFEVSNRYTFISSYISCLIF